MITFQLPIKKNQSPSSLSAAVFGIIYCSFSLAASSSLFICCSSPGITPDERNPINTNYSLLLLRLYTTSSQFYFKLSLLRAFKEQYVNPTSMWYLFCFVCLFVFSFRFLPQNVVFCQKKPFSYSISNIWFVDNSSQVGFIIKKNSRL